MRSLRILNKIRSPHTDHPFQSKYDGDKQLISHMLRILYKSLEKNPTKWIVEFGVHGNDGGVFLDFLIRDGYSGVLIEGTKSGFSEVEQIYKKISNRITCINAYVEPTGENSLDNLLHSTSCPEIFDVLLIDIDSIDYQVWESLKNYHPIFVIIEFNNEYGPNLKRIHNVILNKWLGETSFAAGSSIKSIVELGRTKGYSLVTTTRNNAYFVREEFLHAFHLDEVNIDDLFDYSLFDIRRSILSFKQLVQFYCIYGYPLFINKLKKLIGKNLKK